MKIDGKPARIHCSTRIIAKKSQKITHKHEKNIKNTCIFMYCEKCKKMFKYKIGERDGERGIMIHYLYPIDFIAVILLIFRGV